MKTHYYTASSLDGFIATPDHSLDWLFSQDFDEGGEMAYPRFMEAIGALAMGASTYEWLLRTEGDQPWPYSQPTWVFSHRQLQALPGADIRFVQDDIVEAHAAMSQAAGGKDIWVVGGGDLAGQFADAGLLDEVWIQFAPVSLGSGAPLFPRRLDFELLEVARNRGFLCGHYRVIR